MECVFVHDVYFGLSDNGIKKLTLQKIKLKWRPLTNKNAFTNAAQALLEDVTLAKLYVISKH